MEADRAESAAQHLAAWKRLLDRDGSDYAE
jgi:hypothetical protein